MIENKTSGVSYSNLDSRNKESIDLLINALEEKTYSKEKGMSNSESKAKNNPESDLISNIKHHLTKDPIDMLINAMVIDSDSENEINFDISKIPEFKT